MLKAKKMSAEEFKTKFIELGLDKSSKTIEIDEDTDDYYSLIGEIVYDDIEGLDAVDFDFENIEAEQDDETGFHSVGDLHYFGVIAGGDWEYPVFFILYINENNEIASYIPEDGNVYNKKLKSAFGNNDGYESSYVNGKHVETKVYGDPDAMKEQYGIDGDDFDGWEHFLKSFNFDAMKKEILTKIEVI